MRCLQKGKQSVEVRRVGAECHWLRNKIDGGISSAAQPWQNSISFPRGPRSEQELIFPFPPLLFFSFFFSSSLRFSSCFSFLSFVSIFFFLFFFGVSVTKWYTCVSRTVFLSFCANCFFFFSSEKSDFKIQRFFVRFFYFSAPIMRKEIVEEYAN